MKSAVYECAPKAVEGKAGSAGGGQIIHKAAAVNRLLLHVSARLMLTTQSEPSDFAKHAVGAFTNKAEGG